MSVFQTIGFLCIALAGAVISYRGSDQKYSLYRYGFWSFSLFVVAQMLKLVNNLIFVSFGFSTVINLTSIMLEAGFLLVLAVGFYKDLKYN